MVTTRFLTKYPDGESSRTIGLLRWVLMVLVVVIHTDLRPDTGCAESTYGVFYLWMENVIELATPLFFLISGYLFVASDRGFTWRVFTDKCRRRVRTWLIPYILWNTLFLLFYGLMGLLLPSALGEIPPLQEMTFVDVLKSYWCIRGEGFNSGPIDAPLWFLRDLMVVALFTPLFYSLVKFHKASLVVPLVLASLPHQLGFEPETACFIIGCWLNVWIPSLSDWLRKPLWWPLGIYLGTVLLLMSRLPLLEWLLAPVTLVRNLSGMLLIARLCHKSVVQYPSVDWRTLATPVFFVFAFHSLPARALTKLSANWLLAHGSGGFLYITAQLLNVVLSIAISLLAYNLLKRIWPWAWRWLSGLKQNS